MSKNYFTLNLKEKCKELVKDQKLQDDYIAKIENFKLQEKEETMLTLLFPPDFTAFKETLEEYDWLLKVMRDQKQLVWLDVGEIDELFLDKETLEDTVFLKKMIASVYAWQDKNYPELAMAVLRKFDQYTIGDFLFNELDEPWDSYYIRITLIIFGRYFYYFPEEYRMFVFTYDWLILLISSGFDLEQMTKNAVGYFVTIDNRRRTALHLASALLLNESKIGIDKSGEIRSVNFWLKEYFKYCKDKFEGMKLLEFINDKDRWINCSLEDKMVIKTILLVYGYLITGTYVYQDVDINKIKEAVKNKPDYLSIKREVEGTYVKDSVGQFKDVQAVIDYLSKLSDKYYDPQISELYFFDEKQNKFVWAV